MIQWTEEYSVGNDTIDEQHKELVAIMNEVQQMIEEHDFSYFNIVEIITRLEEYIKMHFEFEEHLMVKSDYPAIAEHASQHNYLRFKIFNTSILEINTPQDFYIEILSDLSDWLINHILISDKRLAQYIANKQEA